MNADLVLTERELERIFRLKYGDLATVGWGPRIRNRYHYYSPDEHYEAMVDKLVTNGVSWLEVGGGRHTFPSNARLAKMLADRCELLVVVDPDETVQENPLAHERVKCPIEDYRPDRTFDVVTLRMVAEHIAAPQRALASIGRLTKPGGKAVVYTINRWAPVPLLTWITPFWFHHPLKRLLWGTETRDTFPVQYKMNTREDLDALFRDAGFVEDYFAYLDDCRTTSRFLATQLLELSVWRLLKRWGARYPETCLLGVYVRA
jgi:SAM-dependent methyltransferase